MSGNGAAVVCEVAEETEVINGPIRLHDVTSETSASWESATLNFAMSTYRDSKRPTACGRHACTKKVKSVRTHGSKPRAIFVSLWLSRKI